MNIRNRRAAQAARHRAELESAQLQIRLLAERVHYLTNADPYKAGFREGCTVMLQQLQLWLRDSRASAEQLIAVMPVDHDNPDFKLGFSIATAWVDEAMEQLGIELERRAHEVAAGHQEDVPGESHGAGGRD